MSPNVPQVAVPYGTGSAARIRRGGDLTGLTEGRPGW
jgi:hypothetical protein